MTFPEASSSTYELALVQAFVPDARDGWAWGHELYERLAAGDRIDGRGDSLGATIDEALPTVEKYLDRAFTEGLPRVHIVHGVGSGRLRQAIIALLEHHPLVRRFQAGDAGGGTTIVELEG